uniref:BTB domain-containing protein n=1 Tax=Leersia perrieri TaxID=77586 RepID=A0A0D9XJR5_9ORYZ
MGASSSSSRSARGALPRRPPSPTGSAATVATSSGHHVLHIRHYSVYKATTPNGICIKSQPFNVGGHTWQLGFFPNGYDNDADHADYACVGIALIDGSDGPVIARYRFEFADAPRHLQVLRSGEDDRLRAFDRENNIWGEVNFVKREKLERAGLVVGDAFSIRCDIVVYKRVSTPWYEPVEEATTGGREENMPSHRLKKFHNLWASSPQTKDVGAGDDKLHLIFLLPGASCSDLEARLTESYQPSVPSCEKGLWVNTSDLSTYHYEKCFQEQMSLVYDPVHNEYRNLPGVETRVPNFGITRGLRAVRIRRRPSSSGIASLGGMVALEFVWNTPLAWRNKYIKHLILITATLSPGFVYPMINLAFGQENVLHVPNATALSLRPMWRSFETSMASFPSPKVYGHMPIRWHRAFSETDAAKDVLFRGTHVYWEGNFDKTPENMLGDGDGTINLISMLAFNKEMRQQLGQKGQFKLIKLDKAGHTSILTYEWALQRIIQEILEVNQNSSYALVVLNLSFAAGRRGEPPPQCSASAAGVIKSSGHHVFEISDYSLLKATTPNGKSIKSGSFKVGGHRWHLELYPNGYSADQVDVVAIHVVLENGADDKTVHTHIRLRYIDTSKHDAYKPLSDADMRGETVLDFDRRKIKRRESIVPLKNMEERYVVEDKLAIRCDIVVITKFSAKTKTTTTKSVQFVDVPPADQGQHLRALHSSKVGADVVFQVGERRFAAHRCVLAVQSPVFNAELYGKMKESDPNQVVHIEDTEPDVFDALLTFVYTGLLPKMKKEDEMAMAQRLLIVADRYDLKRLRLICEDRLCKYVDKSTVINMLVLLDELPSCEGLKKACLEFLAKFQPKTLYDLIVTEALDYLTANYTSVVEKLSKRNPFIQKYKYS